MDTSVEPETRFQWSGSHRTYLDQRNKSKMCKFPEMAHEKAELFCGMHDDTSVASMSALERRPPLLEIADSKAGHPTWRLNLGSNLPSPNSFPVCYCGKSKSRGGLPILTKVRSLVQLI